MFRNVKYHFNVEGITALYADFEKII